MTEYNEKILAIPMPERIKALPVSPQGFPTPWFVQWFDDGAPSEPGTGFPDFRVIDSRKLSAVLNGSPKCWICGETMGVHRVFVIGPMCAINRVISEPPSHRECAEYAAKACPFLATPRMRRNEVDLPAALQPAAGYHIDRNPGAVCLWETRDYKPFRAPQGRHGVLFKLGEPKQVDWYAKGRKATRDEVLASINSGYPQLEKMAKYDGRNAVEQLEQQRKLAMKLIPSATIASDSDEQRQTGDGDRAENQPV